MDPDQVVKKLHSSFKSGKTKAIKFRKEQLRKLYNLLHENKDDIVLAMQADLNKPSAESIIMEIEFVKTEVCEAINNVDAWAKRDYVPKNMINKMNTIYNVYEPLGVSLIIGAWNYPIQLTFGPLCAAIAAGNCVLLKPSELSTSTAALVESLVSEYLDQECYIAMQGAIEETTAILKCRFDHIFFTGSTMVGKIIVRAAAENLSKITLELGGKSPCYISEDSDIKLASRRVGWGKYVNAGQTCVAPDYVLCHPSIEDEFIRELRITLKEFFGEEPKNSADYGRIINVRHFNRLTKLMSSGVTMIGGDTDIDEKYIAPTVLGDVKPSDPVMQEEIFGPLLPIINVESTEEAIEFINAREKPLALYVFSKDQSTIDKFISETSSGAVCANDTLMYCSVDHLPFGGIGYSGTGAYHGKIGFEEFSHKKAVYATKQMLESVNSMRYPPYNDTNVNRAVWLCSKNINRSPSDIWYIPCLLLGFLASFIMKILGLPKYFLT